MCCVNTALRSYIWRPAHRPAPFVVRQVCYLGGKLFIAFIKLKGGAEGGASEGKQPNTKKVKAANEEVLEMNGRYSMWDLLSHLNDGPGFDSFCQAILQKKEKSQRDCKEAWYSALEDKRRLSSPCALFLGGLLSKLWVTSVPLWLTVKTHPMSSISCTGYKYQIITWAEISGNGDIRGLISFDYFLKHFYKLQRLDKIKSLKTIL